MERRAFIATVGAGLIAAGRPARPATKSYTLETDPLGNILKTPDGRTIFEYMTKKPENTTMSANSVCCFSPLNTPGGEPITVFGVGHAHYRGLFFAWHTVEFHEKLPALNEGRGRGRGRGPGGPGAPGGQGAEGGPGVSGGAGPNAAPGGGARGGPGGGGGRGMVGGAPPPPTDPEVIARQNAPGTGDVFRGDYWGWGRYAPMTGRVIQSRGVRLVNADADAAELEFQNDWIMNNTAMLQEVTTARVHEVSGAFVLDLTYKFTPPDMDMLLNEWSFGGLCLAGRSDAVSGYYEGPQGKVAMPNPSMVDGNTDWPDQPWYSRTGTLMNGKTVGGAVINHPSNPPTRWWNPPSTGDINPSIVTFKDFSVPQGQTLTLRYRILTYDGDSDGAKISKLSDEWRNS